MVEDRRCKIVKLGDRDLISLFNIRLTGIPTYIDINPEDGPLPDDAQVVNVWYDMASRCLCACVHSETFPWVENGSQFPNYSTGMERITTRVFEESDQVAALRGQLKKANETIIDQASDIKHAKALANGAVIQLQEYQQLSKEAK